MPEQKSARYRYCQHYLEVFREFEGRLPEEARHDRARRAVHHGKHQLTVAELRECENWLDEKFPAREKKVEPKVPGLFDDDSILRID